MSVFGRTYALAYDDLYAKKDYAFEVTLVEQAVARFGGSTHVKSVLDLGCGTGGHALELLARGYEVVGVDRSPEMLELACSKAQKADVSLRLEQGDIRSFDLDERFDLALLMFAVISYLQTNDDVVGALRNIHRHLQPDGLLIFDAWHGPAVLAEGPEKRQSEVAVDGRKTLRLSRPELDVRRHLCHVHYDVRLTDGDTTEHVQEAHTIRYFFPLELELLLKVAGFETLALTPFGDLDGSLDQTVWSIFAVARATE